MHPAVSYIVASFAIIGTIATIIIHLKAIGKFEGIVNTKQQHQDASVKNIMDTLKDHDGRLREVETSVKVVMAEVKLQMQNVERELIRMRDAVHDDRVDMQTKLLKALVDKNRPSQLDQQI